MSWLCGAEPDTGKKCPAEVEIALLPRSVDIGGFEVHRALPATEKRMVGPFIFWDQMGPGEFAPGHGVDVRPHPHIGLATVTYLFDGSLDHKDSLANDLRILPGDVNLMYAGAGIVHSERTGKDIRQGTSRLHGIQSWMAQPKIHESGGPGFTHVAGEDIAVMSAEGIDCRLILGDLFGLSSPIPSQWQTVYADIHMREGAILELPKTIEERALSIVQGSLLIGGTTYMAPQMVVFTAGRSITVRAQKKCQAMLLGGAAMDGPRYIWWNLVSSSLDTIKVAAREWHDGKFPSIPGDDSEYIPLPDLPFPHKQE